MPDNKQIMTEFLKALGSGDAKAVCTGTSVMSGTRDKAALLDTLGLLRQVTRNGIEFKVLSMTAEADRVSCEFEGTSTLVNDCFRPLLAAR
jgi:limonene-1,2-epoxide hydrolase